jgi:hypothetical protein
MEESTMPQDPNKGKKAAAPPPKGSNKPMAKPTEITAKTVDYKGSQNPRYVKPAEGAFRRVEFGERERRFGGGRSTITTRNSRAMAEEGTKNRIRAGAAGGTAKIIQEMTPNSVVSSEFKTQVAADKRRANAMEGPRSTRLAATENTKRLANQAAKMRSQLDARKPTGATMDQKDSRGRTQVKPPPRTPTTQQSSGGGSGSTPPRRPSTSGGGSGGGGGSSVGGRRSRGAVGAAIAAAGAVGAMAGRASKRGDEVAAYNKGKADGRTFTPSGMRSSGQNVAQPTNTRPGVRDNMYASSNLRKIMMKGK